MIRKHSVLIGISISMLLLSIAMAIYSGGTYHDKNAVGFDWTQNYISNLFESKVLNGFHNPLDFPEVVDRKIK